MALGKILKEAREARGLSIFEVAEATRMMVQMVEELENEDFHRIAAPIYGKGFIRLYAEYVGVESRPLTDEFLALYSAGGRSAPEPAAGAGDGGRPDPPEDDLASAGSLDKGDFRLSGEAIEDQRYPFPGKDKVSGSPADEEPDESRQPFLSRLARLSAPWWHRFCSALFGLVATLVGWAGRLDRRLVLWGGGGLLLLALILLFGSCLRRDHGSRHSPVEFSRIIEPPLPYFADP